MNIPLGRRQSDHTIDVALPSWLRTLLGGLLLVGMVAVLSAFIGRYELQSSHERDINEIRTDIQRVLDVVCLDRAPKPRPCE